MPPGSVAKSDYQSIRCIKWRGHSLLVPWSRPLLSAAEAEVAVGRKGVSSIVIIVGKGVERLRLPSPGHVCVFFASHGRDVTSHTSSVSPLLPEVTEISFKIVDIPPLAPGLGISLFCSHLWPSASLPMSSHVAFAIRFVNCSSN
jgi:hypothetical protein